MDSVLFPRRREGPRKSKRVLGLYDWESNGRNKKISERIQPYNENFLSGTRGGTNRWEERKARGDKDIIRGRRKVADESASKGGKRGEKRSGKNLEGGTQFSGTKGTHATKKK